MSFENTKQTIFTGTQLDYEEIVEIPEGYEKAELKDFEDGTLIRGRPEMASVSSFTLTMTAKKNSEQIQIIHLSGCRPIICRNQC